MSVSHELGVLKQSFWYDAAELAPPLPSPPPLLSQVSQVFRCHMNQNISKDQASLSLDKHRLAWHPAV